MTEITGRLSTALAGRYKIERHLGEGGMATVYLAQDLKHNRKVAVKVLRPDLATTLGPERFLREIEIAANLTHPHILPLYDSGEADGFLYYVLPYIEGESLRTRLAEGGELPIADAVRVLRDITDALAEAHSKGVVHRDIKPDNVMLSGRHALVTDFGVAKAVSEATGRQQLTTAGVALGTPAYMAPEQAAADPHIDHRADIYALGSVAYELLAGRPPFTGTTPQMILSAHVTQAPEAVTKHRETVPPELAQLVMRCLEKKPADRWQSAEEILRQLEAMTTPSLGITPTDTMPVSGVHRPAARSRVVFAAVIAIGILAVAVVMLRDRSGLSVIQPGTMTRVTLAPELEQDPALRPDGEFIAYAAGPTGQARIYVRQVGAGREIPVTEGFDGNHRGPQWSPDGTTIAFQSRGSIYLVDAFGGTPRLVVEPQGGEWLTHPAWSPDGQRLAYVRGVAEGGAQRTGVELVSRALPDGDEVVLTSGFDLHSVAWSPDGTLIAFVSGASGFTFPAPGTGGPGGGNIDPSTVMVIAATGGAPVAVTDSTSMNLSPTWPPGGRELLYVSSRGGSRDVYQIRLSPDGRPVGESVRVTSGNDVQTISVAADGRLAAYSKYEQRANLWSVPIPAVGTASLSEARAVTRGDQYIENAALSADGQWLAFDSNRDGNQEVYKMALPDGQPERLTNDPAEDYSPSWSPDGTEIAFHTLRHGNRDIYVMAADGRNPQRVTATESQDLWPHWSPDGTRLAFLSNREGAFTLYILVRGEEGAWSEPRKVGAATWLGLGSWSPTGREFAAVLESPGGLQLRIYDLETGAQRVPPSVEAERVSPIRLTWTADGRSMYVHGTRSDGLQGLWEMSTTTTERRLLARLDRGVYAYQGTDGERLYFTVFENESDVWTMELERR